MATKIDDLGNKDVLKCI